MINKEAAKKAARHQWRSVGPESIMAEQCQAHGPRGVVAAAAPTAALIGTEALRAGGNAFDAAVAAALAETVLLPPKCGLAGDLIALVWHPGHEMPEALLAIGGAPHGLAAVTQKGELKETGPMSVGVPGAPAGYLALAELGILPLAQLVQPAMDLARKGFAWSRICSVLAEESAALVANNNPNGTIYYPGGAVIEPGTIVKLNGMANLLEELVVRQKDFLSGKVGEAIVTRVQAAGGIITRKDLQLGRAEWVPPYTGHLVDMPFFVTPAPTHGPSLADATAGLVEGKLQHASGSILGDVMNAIDKRRKELADPGGTSMVSAVDQNGAMVCIVHSNSYPRFGSGLIVEEYDLILSNRAGRGFSSDPNHPNFPVQGRRPATTLHAWGVKGRRGERILGATPGGANQMPWNAQTLARLAEGEHDIGRLIAAPRWEWKPADDSITVEFGFTANEIARIESQANKVTHMDRWAARSAMQIIIHDSQKGLASAAADPRTVGMALAL